MRIIKKSPSAGPQPRPPEEEDVFEPPRSVHPTRRKNAPTRPSPRGSQALELEPVRERCFVLALKPGEEVVQSLQRLAREHGLGAGYFQGIGAFSEVALGYYHPEEHDYRHIVLGEQVEALAITGNFSRKGGEHKVHAHVVVARSDGSAFGGHLIRARVRPTVELFVTALPGALERRIDEDTGMAVLDLEASRRTKAA